MVGFIGSISASRCSGVIPANLKIRSMSLGGIPVEAATVCRISHLRVSSGSASAKSGSNFVTGVDQSKFPRATSRAIIRVVSGLVFEPIMKRVRPHRIARRNSRIL